MGGWSGVKAGDACTKTGATCMVSASPTEVTDQMVDCNGTTMTFVPFTGTVGEAFVTPPKNYTGCDGLDNTAADCALGPAEIDASITSSSLAAKGETAAEADDMSDVVSSGDMTAMSTDGSSGGTLLNYRSTVAAVTAAAAAIGVVALL